MPSSDRRERYAHRARWRLPPNQRGDPPQSSRAALAPNRQAQRQGRELPPASKPVRSTSIMAPIPSPGTADPRTDPTALGLPLLFSAAEAAELLRRLGLTEMTECALRTRAYRRQVPFHMNGRRIRFTASDLREIVESQARRPSAADAPPAAASTSRRTPRRSAARTGQRPAPTWRARKAPSPATADGEQR